MEKIIALSFGELFLKGRNRKYFVDLAKRNIKHSLRGLDIENMYSDRGKYFIKGREEDLEEIIIRLKKVFGLAYISPAISCEKDLDHMKEAVKEYMDSYGDGVETFKIAANRADKNFTPKSPEMNNIFGGFVLKNFPGIKVDVHQPDLEVHIDVRDKVYIYGKQFEGAGGLPVGSSGRGLALLSGGIDSPVASYLLAKRGVEVDYIHFHTYPFTSERAFDKVKSLASIVSEYAGPSKLYSINMLNIQKAINEKCQEKYMTILTRRFMMRMANEVAKREGQQMVITGESLGQVASQTIEGITVSDKVVDLPSFRPLIGLDKLEIIKIAERIGTYETSILPYEDCCTVFSPDNPVIKPSLEEIEKVEEGLDIEGLVEEALEKMEIISIEG